MDCTPDTRQNDEETKAVQSAISDLPNESLVKAVHMVAGNQRTKTSDRKLVKCSQTSMLISLLGS